MDEWCECLKKRVNTCSCPKNLRIEIDQLRLALKEIMKLTNWPKNKTDHRLPVVKDAHEIARAALEET